MEGKKIFKNTSHITEVCFTLRTFIAFSSFFLFLEVFLPVENLTFRSRTVGPSAWHRRQIIPKETIVSLNIN